MEDLVGLTIGCVVLDRGGVDVTDDGTVFCWVDGGNGRSGGDGRSFFLQAILIENCFIK